MQTCTRIVQFVSLIRIHWLVIYPLDSAIQLLNCWGLTDNAIQLLNYWGLTDNAIQLLNCWGLTDNAIQLLNYWEPDG